MYAHLHCLAMGSRRWVGHMLHFRLSNEKLDVVAIVTALQDADNFSWPLIECACKAGGHQKERERKFFVAWGSVGKHSMHASDNLAEDQCETFHKLFELAQSAQGN